MSHCQNCNSNLEGKTFLDGKRVLPVKCQERSNRGTHSGDFPMQYGNQTQPRVLLLGFTGNPGGG
jgi:hypothetical protein